MVGVPRLRESRLPAYLAMIAKHRKWNGLRTPHPKTLYRKTMIAGAMQEPFRDSEYYYPPELQYTMCVLCGMSQLVSDHKQHVLKTPKGAAVDFFRTMAMADSVATTARDHKPRQTEGA